MAAHSSAMQTVTFRPDRATVAALKQLEVLFKAKDRSDIIRDAIKAYERSVLMNHLVAACRQHGAESERIVEEFEAAGDALPD